MVNAVPHALYRFFAEDDALLYVGIEWKHGIEARKTQMRRDHEMRRT